MCEFCQVENSNLSSRLFIFIFKLRFISKTEFTNISISTQEKISLHQNKFKLFPKAFEYFHSTVKLCSVYKDEKMLNLFRVIGNFIFQMGFPLKTAQNGSILTLDSSKMNLKERFFLLIHLPCPQFWVKLYKTQVQILGRHDVVGVRCFFASFKIHTWISPV